jgi:hypothetical protein
MSRRSNVIVLVLVVVVFALAIALLEIGDPDVQTEAALPGPTAATTPCSGLEGDALTACLARGRYEALYPKGRAEAPTTTPGSPEQGDVVGR